MVGERITPIVLASTENSVRRESVTRSINASIKHLVLTKAIND